MYTTEVMRLVLFLVAAAAKFVGSIRPTLPAHLSARGRFWHPNTFFPTLFDLSTLDLLRHEWPLYDAAHSKMGRRKIIANLEKCLLLCVFKTFLDNTPIQIFFIR